MATYGDNSEAGGLLGGLNIYGNIRKGGAAGDIAAGAGAARLASKAGAFGDTSSAIGAGASDVLGGLEVYQGLKQGGVAGYGEAAIGAGRLGLGTGLIASGSATAEAIPVLGAALGVYNFGKNYRSGATGSDTLQGLEAGASIGSAIPGVGTLIGAGVGAAVGAISSIFGPGRRDPENVGWNQYAQAYQKGGAQAVAGASPSQNFQMLAGIFDSRGSAIPFYNAYGRMGESKFFTDMTAKVNQAVTSGQVQPNATPAQIYSQVVEPWITSMGGKNGWQNTSTIQGAPEKAAVGQMLTSLIGQYQAGQITSSTPLGISGQTVALQPYAGHGAVAPAHMPTNKTPAAPAATPNALPSAPGAPMAGNTGIIPYPPSTGTGGSNSPTDTASPGTSPGTDPASIESEMSGLLGNLFGSPTAGNPLSGVGTYGALTGAGLAAANAARSSNASTIAPINAIGQPFVNAGNTLLGNAMGGQLTPQQQQVVSTSQQQGKTLVDAATPVGQIAQGLYSQYQSGNLKPADQAQLDQQTTAAKAQIAQSLGPNVDSTVLSTYYNQIDQQALITKNSMLNSYLATGNTEFDQWAATTTAGQATILAGQEYAVNQIDNTFNKALQATTLGGSDILAGIQLAVNSNTQLADAFQNYMGNIAKAYAMQKAGPAPSAGGGGGGGVPTRAGSTLGGGGGGGATDPTTAQYNASVDRGIASDISNTQQQVATDLQNTPEPNFDITGGGVSDVLGGPSYSDQVGLGSIGTDYMNFFGGNP